MNESHWQPILAQIRAGTQNDHMDAAGIDELLPIEELAFTNPDKTSEEWLNFYHFWRQETA